MILGIIFMAFGILAVFQFLKEAEEKHRRQL